MMCRDWGGVNAGDRSSACPRIILRMPTGQPAQRSKESIVRVQILRIPIATIVAATLSVVLVSSQARPPVPTMRGDGPAPAPQPFSITRVDPALDALVASDAKAELMATGFGLNEGPVWVREGKSGYLLVSGLLDNVIYKVAPDKTVSVFMERAGYTGTDINHTGTQTRSGRSHVLLIGPSCTSLDSHGRLIWCADNDRAVMRLEKDGSRTVLSSGLNGKRFSGPNDIAVTSRDAVYLTDNDFGLRDGGANPDKQMPNGIWLIKDGQSTMVLDAMTLGGIPNGITLSPDERYLYATAGQKILRYEVKTDGSLGPGSPFTEGPGIGDGMKVDVRGNVYSTSGAGPGIIRITSPTGTMLGMLNLQIVGGEPKRQICATNVAFGDADGRSLYITACDHVYRVRMKVQGVMPGPKG
jgi:gluconolactonase